MKRLSPRAVVAALLVIGVARAAWAYVDGSTFLDTGNPNPGDGLIGTHQYGTAPNNRGYSIDYGTTASPGWSMGLEQTYGDFYLFNYAIPGNASVNQYSLRVRGDTGQMELGRNVPHPTTQQQLNITAGTSSAPLTGIGVGTYGNAAALFLHHVAGSPTSLRNQIVFGADGQPNIYAMGTDSGANGTADWWLYNSRTNHFVLLANADDSVTVNYGATINGTATVNGPASLLGSTTTIGASGSLVGFYGTTPQSQPTITGCRSDGTALANLLSKLSAMGIIKDRTTP